MAGIGIGGVLLLGVLSLLTGQDFLSMLGPGTGTPVEDASAPAAPTSPEEERLVEFVSFVLDDSQDTWSRLLGPRYERARLVLFTDATDSGCGFAQAATGPFYCPADRKVYIDLGFYRELDARFGAPARAQRRAGAAAAPEVATPPLLASCDSATTLPLWLCTTAVHAVPTGMRPLGS